MNSTSNKISHNLFKSIVPQNITTQNMRDKISQKNNITRQNITQFHEKHLIFLRNDKNNIYILKYIL